jgi:hypothetical protein
VAKLAKQINKQTPLMELTVLTMLLPLQVPGKRLLDAAAQSVSVRTAFQRIPKRVRPQAGWL